MRSTHGTAYTVQTPAAAPGRGQSRTPSQETAGGQRTHSRLVRCGALASSPLLSLPFPFRIQASSRSQPRQPGAANAVLLILPPICFLHSCVLFKCALRMRLLFPSAWARPSPPLARPLQGRPHAPPRKCGSQVASCRLGLPFVPAVRSPT